VTALFKVVREHFSASVLDLGTSIGCVGQNPRFEQRRVRLCGSKSRIDGGECRSRSRFAAEKAMFGPARLPVFRVGRAQRGPPRKTEESEPGRTSLFSAMGLEPTTDFFQIRKSRPGCAGPRLPNLKKSVGGSRPIVKKAMIGSAPRPPPDGVFAGHSGGRLPPARRHRPLPDGVLRAL